MTYTYVDYEGDNVDIPEDDEWREGECDHCYGETVDGPLGPIYCACQIGQGASEDDCVCGPPNDEPEPIKVMDTCGDCIEGRCHWGGQMSRDSIAAVQDGTEFPHRCGCDRHAVSVAYRTQVAG